jgi:hypothetical protein
VTSTPHSHQHIEQRINKDVLELNNLFDKMELTDMYRAFHPTAEDYMFFLSPMETKYPK